MNISKTAIIILTLTLALTGCVTYQEGRLPNLSSSSSLYDSQTPVTYTLIKSANLNYVKGLEGKLIKHLQAYGLSPTRSHAPTEEAPHLQINLDFTPVSPLAPIISGISLTTLPAWATRDFIATAQLFTTDGQQIDYEFKEGYKVIMWLPLMLAAPFNKTPGTNIENVQDTVLSNLANSVSEDISYD